MSTKHLYGLGALVCALGAFETSASADDDGAESRVATTIEELHLGEPVFVSEERELQLVARQGYASEGREGALHSAMAAELGLDDTLQIELEAATGAHVDGAFGELVAFEAGALWSFYSQAATGLAFATGIEASQTLRAPHGEDGSYALGLVFVAYKSLGPLGVNLTLMPELERSNGGETDLAPAAALALIAPADPLVFLAELGAQLGEERMWSAAAGLAVHPIDAIEIGAAALFEHAELSSSTGAQLIMSYEWEPERMAVR